MFPEDEKRLLLRILNQMWEALSAIGYASGLAEDGDKGGTVVAASFRAFMTNSGATLGQLTEKWYGDRSPDYD